MADRFQVGGLYEHCLAEFGRALTVETEIQQLVWAHAHAPEGARAVAMEYVVANGREIQVGLKILCADLQRRAAVPAWCFGSCTLRIAILIPHSCMPGENSLPTATIQGGALWPGAAGVGSAGLARCAEADLRCNCVQRDAGHTAALLQALPGDVFAARFTAMNS